MKFLFAALLVPGLCLGAIWPDNIGAWKRAATLQATLTDRPVWDEYGLKESEAARYENGGESFTATGYRLQDTTGAMAAFDWQRPAKSTPSKLAPLAAETPDGLVWSTATTCSRSPATNRNAAELSALFGSLRNVDTTVLPTLPGILPSQDRVRQQRALHHRDRQSAKFAPAIPPSVAAFHFGAEAQLDFPLRRKATSHWRFSITPPPRSPCSRSRFGEVPGAMVKRSGPLVAVVLSPPDPDSAERLLSQVRYQAR